MFSIEACPLPDNALLKTYDRPGDFTDCYRTNVAGVVTHKEFVTAFYTTPLFKLERIILRWAVSKPSSDIQAEQLADASIDTFAAWQVEDRCENQLLLCDYRGRTRSWLMVTTLEAGGVERTQLFFGSAVTPVGRATVSRRSLLSSMLLGFHKAYSVLLLRAARSKLKT